MAYYGGICVAVAGATRLGDGSSPDDVKEPPYGKAMVRFTG